MYRTHFKKLIVLIMTICMTVSYMSYTALPSFAEEETAQQDDAQAEIMIEDTQPDDSQAGITNENTQQEPETGTADEDIQPEEPQADIPAEDPLPETKDWAEEENVLHEKEVTEESEESVQEQDERPAEKETPEAVPEADEPRLIDGTDPLQRRTLTVSRSMAKGVSTGSSLDPAKIKQISWVHDSWSSLISWNTLQPIDRTHIRKITSVKDEENNELLDDPEVYAGYGYCCEPGTNTPEDLHFGHIFSAEDGAYTVRDGGNEHGRAQKIRAFNAESAKAAGEKYVEMRKLLYYLPGGAGWKSVTKSWYTEFKSSHGLGKRGSKGGVTGYHELAHLALSYKWQQVGGAEHPSGYDAKTMVGWCDDATQKLIKRYGDKVSGMTDVSGLPEPPEDF